MEGCSYYLMLRAFNLDRLMSPMQLIGAGLLLLVFVNLGTMVPSAPGFFGVYQAAATVALGAYAVSSATAFSLALLTNTFQYVLVTAIGLVFFTRRNMSFKALRANKSAGDKEQAAETEEAAASLGLEDANAETGGKAAYSAADS
jgi:glycosyltransferase 2 family protein